MTIVRQLLTNGAYGFPKGQPRRVTPVALACCHITGNSRTAVYTDLHAAAQAERNYANRVGSNGPSSTLYIARDGWGIEAIDATKHAAWSNGDVSSPNTANPGIRRVLALRAKGYNANEAYWEEFECVGYGSAYPITQAQVDTMGVRIAARSKASGLPINRETVHGHWEINGVDRQNCPHPDHERFLDRVIAAARAVTGDTQGDDMPAIAVTPQGTIYAYIVRVAAKTGTYGPTSGERGEIGPKADGSPWVGNALGVYGIDGLDGKRAFRLGNGAFVLETAVTATKWERSAAEPAPTPEPQRYAVTVGGKSVGEVELP